MRSIAIMLMHAPYGDMAAAEALRHAMAAASYEWRTVLLLTDKGVHLARTGHDMGQSGYTDLAESLGDSIGMGVEVYIDRDSLVRERMDEGRLAAGVRIISGAEVSEMIRGFDHTLIF